MVPKEIWIVAWCLMALTNSHIHYNDFLTQISAMDTSIYLAIADSAPDLPAVGSNLVFHGAQRFLFPYLVGLASKFFGISSWFSFQLIVQVSSFVTILFLSRTLKLVDKSNQNWNSILLCIAVFHPFLFRLQIGFSGFVNDAIFLAGLSIFTYGLVRTSISYKFFGLLIMIPSKQTVFLIVPIMYLAELVFSKGPKIRIHVLWLPILIFMGVYYVAISKLIGPFSSPNSTSSMALGFLHWAIEFDGIESFLQLLNFLARGLLGLFLPFLGFVSLSRFNFDVDKLDSSAKLIASCFIAVILQPLISGPSITDASIQRLLSLGLPTLLILIAILGRQNFFVGNRKFLVLFGLLFLGSWHHLFSFIGPVLSYRYIFLSLYLLTSIGVIFGVFWMKNPDSSDRLPSR